MHLQKTIEQLGYSPNEVKVYFASLSLGEATITDIAQNAKIPRTNAQFIILRLYNSGLINFYIKRRRKYWIAENPEKLLTALKEKELFLKEALPEIQALRYDTGVKPTIKFFSGEENIRLIFQDIIETKHNILSLTSMEDALKLLGEDFQDFIIQRYKRHLRVKFLTNRGPETIALKKRNTEELREIRFLPEGFIVKNANFVYGEKVAIMSLNKKTPVGIIIEDKDIAHTQTMLFDTIWAQSDE